MPPTVVDVLKACIYSSKREAPKGQRFLSHFYRPKRAFLGGELMEVQMRFKSPLFPC